MQLIHGFTIAVTPLINYDTIHYALIILPIKHTLIT